MHMHARVSPHFQVAVICTIFLGVLGIDRFIIGRPGLGVGKLLTGGGLGVWALIDMILVCTAKRETGKAYRSSTSRRGHDLRTILTVRCLPIHRSITFRGP